jgi:hypothetical protein
MCEGVVVVVCVVVGGGDGRVDMYQRDNHWSFRRVYFSTQDLEDYK